MNRLALNSPAAPSNPVNADVSVDNMSWWFWVKAGAGFSVGAAVVYVLGQLLWLLLVINVPTLLIFRWFKAI